MLPKPLIPTLLNSTQFSQKWIGRTLSVFGNSDCSDLENPPAPVVRAEERQEALRTVRGHYFESSLCASVNPVLHLLVSVSIC